jgi:hypothetical protein
MARFAALSCLPEARKGEGQMTLLRIFPRQTHLTPKDDYAIIGLPGLFRPPNVTEVNVSCAFSWDRKLAEDLAAAWGQYYPIVKLGGPAIAPPDEEFIPGRYIRRGVTFTSRGCQKQCPWCLVPKTEGKLRLLEIKPGNIINDNNLLQCGHEHVGKVIEMLKKERFAARFAGGIDAELVDDWFAEALRGLRIDELYLAMDHPGAFRQVEQAAAKLSFLKTKSRQLRAYVLIGYNHDTLEKAESRCWDLMKIGVTPFAQLYQPADTWVEYSAAWKALSWRWMRPAVMAARERRQGEVGEVEESKEPRPKKVRKERQRHVRVPADPMDR